MARASGFLSQYPIASKLELLTTAYFGGGSTSLQFVGSCLFLFLLQTYVIRNLPRVVFLVIGFLKFNLQWLMIVLVALGMNAANVIGYTKCSRGKIHACPSPGSDVTL